MRIFFLSLFITINNVNLFSQKLDYKQKYIDNKNIIWAAEISKDYVLDDYKQADLKQINKVYTLKHIGSKDYLNDNDVPLNLNIMLTQAAFNNQITIYSDSNLTYQTDFSYIKNSSLNLTSDLLYDNFNSVAFKFDSLYEYRLRYIAYYDSTKANWNIEVIAMAPLYYIKNENGDITNKKALFWIKVNNQKENLNSKDIIWAKRISDNRKMIYAWVNQFQDSIPSFNVFKNMTENHVNHFIDKIESNNSIKIYDYGSGYPYKDKQLISLDQRRKLLYSIDTVSLPEKTVIVTTRLNPYDLRELRLVHNWFWNDKKKQLSIRLERVGLMTNVTDDAGNYLYKKAYFYRVNED